MSDSQNSQNVIDVRGLTRRFRKSVALDQVNLSVPAGRVFGLVGENGAGKTTLIRHVLGLLKAEEGAVSVFGRDPVADPEGVLSRIGYLSEDRDLPGWMRVSELMRYTQAFYPGWDDAYAEELRRTFNLDPSQKIKHLSRGQKALAGLLIALAYRPPLLLLDEPSSGLDAVVRREILGAVVRTVADEGRTVVFSSHLLDEVERVADDVAMLHRGKLIMCDEIDSVKGQHRRVTLRFSEAQSTPPKVPGALSCNGAGREWTVVCNGKSNDVAAAVQALGAEIVEDAAPTLEDIFVAHVGVDRAALREE
ncbi:MAG: ABC transporter ATP-binding protein [bacterium]|nr:ABC transporter ATP-binding protein [bacterium]